MHELLPDGPDRDRAIARLAELERRQAALDEQLVHLNRVIEDVRASVKPSLAFVHAELNPIVAEIDTLRGSLFPRMEIG